MCITLVTLPKKRTISRSTEQVFMASLAHRPQLRPTHPLLIQQPQTQENQEQTADY